MRWAAVVLLALAAPASWAQRILLVPVDNRPAAGQFAQMIGAIAGAEVRLPPYRALGQFTQAGSPGDVLDWLEGQDYSDVAAVVVSTDMVAYGGLIASRTNRTTHAAAIARLRRLATIRRTHPSVKFYGFSAITRILPTATRAAASWRLELGKYVQLREEARKGIDLSAPMAECLRHVPRAELRDYDAMRLRNLAVQRDLLKMTATGVFDYLMLGQDDASPKGPHVRETARLRKDVEDLSAESKVYFCEGIDQHANVLVSRALLRQSGYVPRVKIVYSDDAGRKVYADYETKPVEKSVQDQLYASGARPVAEDGSFDFALYLNTPQPQPQRFAAFLEDLAANLDVGEPIAVADINLNNHAAADQRLFAALSQAKRSSKLLSYAGWNTAGNTVGTAIPAANMVLLGRRNGGGIEREAAREEFLLHRLVNDYAYHRFTRPAAYSLISALRGHASREEIYGDDYAIVSSFVRRDLKGYLDRYFNDQFRGEGLSVNGKRMTVASLDKPRIFLPWPRAYEVRLEFRIVLHETGP